MRHFSLTIFIGTLFLVAAYFEWRYPAGANAVSSETQSGGVFHETPQVTPGTSADGLVTISPITSAPFVPTRQKFPDHERAIRAFIATNHVGNPALYLEQVLPHRYQCRICRWVRHNERHEARVRP